MSKNSFLFAIPVKGLLAIPCWELVKSSGLTFDRLVKNITPDSFLSLEAGLQSSQLHLSLNSRSEKCAPASRDPLSLSRCPEPLGLAFPRDIITVINFYSTGPLLLLNRSSGVVAIGSRLSEDI